MLLSVEIHFLINITSTHTVLGIKNDEYKHTDSAHCKLLRTQFFFKLNKEDIQKHQQL